MKYHYTDNSCSFKFLKLSHSFKIAVVHNFEGGTCFQKKGDTNCHLMWTIMVVPEGAKSAWTLQETHRDKAQISERLLDPFLNQVS